MNEVDSLETLYKCGPKVGGYTVKITDTNEVYTYSEEEDSWIKTQDSDGLPTLYNINKQIIAQMKPMTINEKMQAMIPVEEMKKKTKATYYMLLFKEISYYTLFVLKNKSKSLSQEVIECLNNLGDIYSIEKDDNGAIEIWIDYQDEPVVGYLFPYDNGVVEIGG